MSVQITMNDQEFLRRVASATSAGIIRATTYLHTQARLALNVPNTGVRVSAEDVQKHHHFTFATWPCLRQMGGRHQ